MDSTISSLATQITNIRAVLFDMDKNSTDYVILQKRIYNLALALQIELDIRDFVAY